MKTIATYKAEVTSKKTVKIPMPKYRAGQEILIDVKDYYVSVSSENYEEKCYPRSLIIDSARFNHQEMEWVYETQFANFKESYITKNLIK